MIARLTRWLAARRFEREMNRNLQARKAARLQGHTYVSAHLRRRT